MKALALIAVMKPTMSLLKVGQPLLMIIGGPRLLTGIILKIKNQKKKVHLKRSMIKTKIPKRVI